MNCPIKLIAYTIAPKQAPLSCNCDEKECAWWFSEKGGCCSITAIAQLLELARHGNFGG